MLCLRLLRVYLLCVCLLKSTSQVARIKTQLVAQRAERVARKSVEGVPLVQVIKVEKPSAVEPPRELGAVESL